MSSVAAIMPSTTFRDNRPQLSSLVASGNERWNVAFLCPLLDPDNRSEKLTCDGGREWGSSFGCKHASPSIREPETYVTPTSSLSSFSGPFITSW